MPFMGGINEMSDQTPRPLLPCEALFGLRRGAQIIAAVEEDTGAPCPCRQGRVCPLLGTLEPVAEVEVAAAAV